MENTNHSWTASHKSRLNHFYVPGKQGGSVMMQLEAAYAVEITKLTEYIDRTEDTIIVVVRTQQHNTDSVTSKRAGRLKTEIQK